MDDLVPPAICHEGNCERPPRFQVQLDAVGAGARPVRETAEVCASHLGEVFQALASWARSHGISDGHLTVLAVDPPVRPDPGQPDVAAPARSRYAFTTLRLTP